MTSNRAQWDIKRFLSTLGYFGEIPFLGSFRWLQQLAGQNVTAPGAKMTATPKIALFGYPEPEFIDALKQLFSTKTTLVIAKPDIPSSDFTQLIRSVDAIIFLSSNALEAYVSSVASVSTLDFWQSIGKEIADGSTVERSVFDFTASSCDLCAWGALDDVVMGGVSKGSFFLRRAEKTYAIFAGNVSTRNSGGFSSVRTQNFEPPFDFSGWTGMQLRVKGDGQRYKFILRNSGAWDSPAYIYSFDTVVDEWTTIYVPFEDMTATFRARSVSDAPPLNPECVFSIQLMLSKFEYDKRLNPNFTPGTFELAIADISLYRPRREIPILIVSSEQDKWDTQPLDAASIDYKAVEIADVSDSDAIAKAIAQALKP